MPWKLIDGKTIMDYLREQADKYDASNIQWENNAINIVLRLYDKMGDDVLDIIHLYGADMKSTLKYQTLTNKITEIVVSFYTGVYKSLQSSVSGYYTRGYDHMDDLISMAMELSEQINKQKISEMQLNPDKYSIDFMKDHAFQLVKGFSDEIINDIRTKLGALLVSGGYSKDNVSGMVEQTLHVNRSRANMIAQTEMSMAYNAGALKRMDEFNILNNNIMKKYWYGFKYSVNTCTYCRPRIGNKYDINDDSEHLPAHPRCRCIWLPYIEGWETPISRNITRRADMLKRSLRPDELYNKINRRLGINYAEYMDEDIARRYIAGDRTNVVKESLENAKQMKINQVISDFDISSSSSTDVMNDEFKVQMSFWKKFVAQKIAESDITMTRNSYEAIKGIMVLPWSGEQLDKWNKLLKQLQGYL